MSRRRYVGESAAANSPSSEFSGRGLLIAGSALGITTGVTATLFYSMGALIPPLLADQHWARGDVSLAVTFTTLGLFLSGATAGRLSDRHGAATVGVVGLILYAAVVVGLAWLATKVWHLWIGYFLAAVFGAGSTPVVLVRPISATFRAQRGLALGLALTGGGLAGFWVPLFTHQVVSTFGWRWGLTALAGMAVAAAPLVWLGLRSVDGAGRPTAAPTKIGATAGEARRSAVFWSLSAAGLAMAAGVAGLVVHLPPILRDLGADPASAARLASVVGITSVIGRIVIGTALDRFRPARVGALVLVMSALGVLLLRWGGLPFALPAIASLGLAAGAELDLLAYLTARYFGQRAFGAIYGWQYSVFALGYGISPFVIGRLRDQQGSYSSSLAGSAALMACAAVALLVIDAKGGKRVMAKHDGPQGES